MRIPNCALSFDMGVRIWAKVAPLAPHLAVSLGLTDARHLAREAMPRNH